MGERERKSEAQLKTKNTEMVHCGQDRERREENYWKKKRETWESDSERVKTIGEKRGKKKNNQGKKYSSKMTPFS